MDTQEKAPHDKSASMNEHKPSTTQHTMGTPTAKQKDSGTHKGGNIDLPVTSPSNVTIESNLPAEQDLKHSFASVVGQTPVKHDKSKKRYAALWGDRTPSHRFGQSVALEMRNSPQSRNEACFGFGDENAINSPTASPIPKVNSSTPNMRAGSPSDQNSRRSQKFTTPPKMQFNKLNVKLVESPLAKKHSPNAQSKVVASPPNATSASKVTPTKKPVAESGTSTNQEIPQVAHSSSDKPAAKDAGLEGNKITPSPKATPQGGQNSPFVIIEKPTLDS